MPCWSRWRRSSGCAGRGSGKPDGLDCSLHEDQTMFARLMGLRPISPDGLHRLIESHTVTAIDVNPRASWISARVPGAMNIDPVNFGDGDLPADKDTVLV